VAYSNVGWGSRRRLLDLGGGGIDYSDGNIVADPAFVDRLRNNFQLSPDSPAIDRAASPRTPGHRLRRQDAPLRAVAGHRAFESC
jgi:hypothetical protein